ncbi:MAG: tyrosine-type recombinase/integrase [Desulfuromonadaceae bacterium]
MSERFGFTERRIKDLPTPDTRIEFFDTTDRLLGLRVSTSGAKSFFIKKRVHGVLIRVTLGSWPDLTLQQARRDCYEALDKLRKGINPNQDKQRRTIENSDKRGILSAVFTDYMAAGGTKGTIKPITRQDYNYTFKNLAGWENKRVEEITPAMVEAKFKELTQTSGNYSANKAVRLIKNLMAHSMKHLKRPSANPVTGFRFHKEPPRRTNVAPEMLPAFIAALDHLKGDIGSDLYKLLLFTGLRKSNAMDLKWSAIDLEKKTLYVAETKNGESLYIPLSGYVTELLQARKDKMQGSLWVFASQSRTGHLTNTSNFDRQLLAQGVKVYPHMLRKRYTTTAKLGCPGFVVDILTSHIPTGSVTDRNYTIPSTEELRPFAEQITQELLRMAGMTD